ncbi:ATP-binding protein [Massilia sp. SM-13]|uniref:ATP-binding protein n=1 Tax=Pseudoduganella rhizocola TaxID=3382643 RepID=UPI0038B57AF3
MIESISFQTRARTIDHLGREQIADCPTAISELWKNAYDAYARNVELALFDGEPAIAVVCDDGHGMNLQEFTTRWLVVGTESKTSSTVTVEEDRNGLPIRTKQGQKGIGRLSSANLGPLLLVVSKRRDSRFVAALIDWRIFENPYLYLNDIQIPVVEFDLQSELFVLLPDLFDRLLSNVWGQRGDTPSERDLRIAEAWRQFHVQELAEGRSRTTQSMIEETVISTAIEERHLSSWSLWKGDSDQGTAMLVADLQFDLIAQFSRMDPKKDSSVQQARDLLFQTLSNFADPYQTDEERGYRLSDGSFSTKVSIWEGYLQRALIESAPPFALDDFYELEHVVDGVIDSDGIFHGRVKAFGSWIEDAVVIKPAIDVPIRKDSFVGPFVIRIGSFEQELSSTSHSKDQYELLMEQAEKYSGLLVFRNGLRVLPYGREGNDFFRIENRRTKHAGREFWALRRLFGKVGISKEVNPNLRDKAGREGLIDNKAAKTFRELVENVLKTTARQFFGTNSALRQKTIPERKSEYARTKAEEARNKQRVQLRKRFRANLEKFSSSIGYVSQNLELISTALQIEELDEARLLELREQYQENKRQFREMSLGEAPRSLGALETKYSEFRGQVRATKELLDSVDQSLEFALETLKPKSPYDIAYSELSANAAFLHRRLRAWYSEARQLLASEQERLAQLLDTRNKAYHDATLPLLEQLKAGRRELKGVSRELDNIRDEQDFENSETFEPYISALTSLRESVDLFGLAQFEQGIADDLREEVERLHSLAQLGITVEIVGHEIEAHEYNITNNLKKFPPEIASSDYFKSVKLSYDALVDRLRFLSPLKLSGDKTRVQITGTAIFNYVSSFFASDLASRGISFVATDRFLKFSILERPSRIYPVFINLVNNSAYWVTFGAADKKILLDVADGKVIVADSGPGVDVEDVQRLFSIFFTRKARGGRGIGLYLSRVNLAAGGHVIGYCEENKLLPGANFFIEFKGARYE